MKAATKTATNMSATRNAARRARRLVLKSMRCPMPAPSDAANFARRCSALEAMPKERIAHAYVSDLPSHSYAYIKRVFAFVKAEQEREVELRPEYLTCKQPSRLKKLTLDELLACRRITPSLLKSLHASEAMRLLRMKSQVCAKLVRSLSRSDLVRITVCASYYRLNERYATPIPSYVVNYSLRPVVTLSSESDKALFAKLDKQALARKQRARREYVKTHKIVRATPAEILAAYLRNVRTFESITLSPSE